MINTPQAAYHFAAAIDRLPEASDEYSRRIKHCVELAKAAEKELRAAHAEAEAVWQEIVKTGEWTDEELRTAQFPELEG